MSNSPSKRELLGKNRLSNFTDTTPQRRQPSVQSPTPIHLSTA
ncbi:hypothetical protein [Microcoleus sp. FACHB-68]|nr:hypothetical protein [Microcoleus sp. FACHB-68]